MSYVIIHNDETEMRIVIQSSNEKSTQDQRKVTQRINLMDKNND